MVVSNMPKKLGGLVCDQCRTFGDYTLGISDWIIVPFLPNYTFYYCSKDCEKKHGYDGRVKDSTK
jgi:hypothetical protein